MKHNAGSRRSRNRGGGKRPGGGRNNFESNGPDVKVRGTAQQVLEKYLALGRDAASAGDRIKSEAYFQYAEHYYRIANADGASTNQNQNRRDPQSPDQNAQPAKPAPVEGSGPQPVIEPRDDAAAEAEVISTKPQAAPETPEPQGGEPAADDDRGKIDESVLPAAAPTAPPPRRRRRAKADKEADGEPKPEPEAAQA